MEPLVWIKSGQFIILFTIICGFVFQNYRLRVIRQWDLEDSEMTKKALETRLNHVEAILEQLAKSAQ